MKHVQQKCSHVSSCVSQTHLVCKMAKKAKPQLNLSLDLMQKLSCLFYHNILLDKGFCVNFSAK